jgi:hypothetical protein
MYPLLKFPVDIRWSSAVGCCCPGAWALHHSLHVTYSVNILELHRLPACKRYAAIATIEDQ